MQHPAIVTVPVDGSQPSGVVLTDEPVTCPKCDRTVAWKATRPYRIRCRHCREDVER